VDDEPVKLFMAIHPVLVGFDLISIARERGEGMKLQSVARQPQTGEG
jgi:hypothetical protein